MDRLCRNVRACSMLILHWNGLDPLSRGNCCPERTSSRSRRTCPFLMSVKRSDITEGGVCFANCEFIQQVKVFFWVSSCLACSEIWRSSMPKETCSSSAGSTGVDAILWLSGDYIMSVSVKEVNLLPRSRPLLVLPLAFSVQPKAQGAAERAPLLGCSWLE